MHLGAMHRISVHRPVVMMSGVVVMPRYGIGYRRVRRPRHADCCGGAHGRQRKSGGDQY
jgi:hypothetical protein